MSHVDDDVYCSEYNSKVADIAVNTCKQDIVFMIERGELKTISGCVSML